MELRNEPTNTYPEENITTRLDWFVSMVTKITNELSADPNNTQ